MIALLIGTFVLVAFGLCLVRVFVGPTLYDRLLALNSTLVKVALIVAAVSVSAGVAAYVDIAIASLLIGLVVNLAVLKLFKTKSFQPPLARLGEGA